MRINLKKLLIIIALFIGLQSQALTQEEYANLKAFAAEQAAIILQAKPITIPFYGIKIALDFADPAKTEEYKIYSWNNPLIPSLVLGYADFFIGDLCFKTYKGKAFTPQCIARCLVYILANNPASTIAQTLYWLGYREPIQKQLKNYDDWLAKETMNWYSIFKYPAQFLLGSSILLNAADFGINEFTLLSNYNRAWITFVTNTKRR